MRSKTAGLLLPVLAIVAAVAAAVGVACSSSSGGAQPCNQAPWQCGTGNTCWPDCVCPSGKTCTPSNCTVQFSCVPSKLNVPMGSNCDLVNGTAQCGDLQTCVAFADGGGGTCRTFCDQSLMCPIGLDCVALSVGPSGSPTEHVCVPPALGLDGGLMIDTGSGSGSGGGSGDGAVMDAPAFDGPQMRQ